MPSDEGAPAILVSWGAVLFSAVFSGLVLVLLGGAARATSYYVDPAGNDGNPGTSAAAPWRAIARVNRAGLAPGDTVFFRRGGLWRSTLAPTDGGAPGRPITFTVYGSGGPAVISGSDLVTGWLLVRGSIYRAKLGERPNNVYVDGGPGWGLTRAPAAGRMAPGTWFWDTVGAYLYVWLPDSSAPSAHTIEAAVRIYGMKVVADAGEKSNIVVDGLTFERTGGYGIFFYSNGEGGRGLSGIVVRNCTVRQTGTGRVDTDAYYNAIHFSGHVELPTAPQFINNDISYSGGHGNGINAQAADGARIIGNRADHFNHHGFDTKHCNHALISGNVAHDGAPGGNGIYQEYSANGVIEQNVVYNLIGSVAGKGSGIQVGTGSRNPLIVSNSIYNVLTGIYLTVAGVVRYNAVSGARSAVVEANRSSVLDHNVWGAAPIFSIDGSAYTFAQWIALGSHPGDVAADPMWAGPARGDFKLQSLSPCRLIGAGADVRRMGSAAAAVESELPVRR